MKFCPNCGQQIEEGTSFCRNCGCNLSAAPAQTPINQVNYVQQPNYAAQKPAQRGKGLAVASLVLGIISLFYSLISLGALSGIEDSLIEAYETSGLESAMVAKISFGIGFVLVVTITGILSLIFGINRKKYGLGKAGIILSSIALVIAVISFIYILTIEI